MRVISIAKLKGGVGATTTAGELAYLLSQNHSVLLVDNDKQGNLSKLFGKYDPHGVCPTAVLLSKSRVHKAKINNNMDIITANMSLLTATWDLSRKDSADQFKRYETLQRLGYKYVIIDNPPDLSLNVINALAASDDVIIPTKIDQWALEGLEVLYQQIAQARQINPHLTLVKTLITMWQNDPVNLSGLQWLKESGYDVFDTHIWYSKKAAECTFYGEPLNAHNPRTWAARDYRALAKEYEKLTGGEKNEF